MFYRSSIHHFCYICCTPMLCNTVVTLHIFSTRVLIAIQFFLSFSPVFPSPVSQLSRHGKSVPHLSGNNNCTRSSLAALIPITLCLVTPALPHLSHTCPARIALCSRSSLVNGRCGEVPWMLSRSCSLFFFFLRVMGVTVLENARLSLS